MSARVLPSYINSTFLSIEYFRNCLMPSCRSLIKISKQIENKGTKERGTEVAWENGKEGHKERGTKEKRDRRNERTQIKRERRNKGTMECENERR